MILTKSPNTKIYRLMDTTNMTIIFCIFAEFPWKFASPQVKLDFILSTINLVYKLLHELPNNVRLRI